jgi:uncharacterized protein (TIGR04222 family)
MPHTARMTNFAADTWGISGPQFLVLYGIVAGAVLALAVAGRVLAGRADAPSLTAGEPRPSDIAYLAGGARLAVYSSLGALRAAGAVEAAPGEKITVTGLPPAGASDLDRAVHAAATRGARTSAIRWDDTVEAALKATEQRLIDAGALRSERERWRQRWGSLALFLVGCLGVARIAAGSANHKPILYVVLATVAVFGFSRILWFVPRTTRLGKRTLARLRREHTYLRPGQAASWTTYGATGAAMGVALFGTAALWEADPVFAQQANITRQAATSSSGYTSSDSSGSSCGGGGSSCGGGGGCGGGGCGG